MNDRLYSIDALFIIGILLLGIVALYELAFRCGKWRSLKEGANSQTQELQSAILTLFSLLLGFTFSMAASRYESRKEILLTESSAIGMAYVRTRMLPEDKQPRARELIKACLDARIGFYESRSGAEKRLDRLEGEIWDVAVQEARRSPTSISALYLNSLNELMDVREKQAVAFGNYIPSSIIAFLLFFCTAATTAVGYQNGLVRKRPAFFSLLYSTLVALTLFLVLDLDRPRRGFIRLDHFNLTQLRQTLSEP